MATSRSRGSCLFKFETAGDVDIDTEAIVADFEDHGSCLCRQRRGSACGQEKMKKSVVLLEDNLRTIRAGKVPWQVLFCTSVLRLLSRSAPGNSFPVGQREGQRDVR